jgi:hypothetical protein
MSFECHCITFATVGNTHQRAEPTHIPENAFDRPMIADPNFDTRLDERLCDVGLEVGMRSIRALVKAATLGFSRRARAGRTVKPEMPTIRSCSPSA